MWVVHSTMYNSPMIPIGLIRGIWARLLNRGDPPLLWGLVWRELQSYDRNEQWNRAHMYTRQEEMNNRYLDDRQRRLHDQWHTCQPLEADPPVVDYTTLPPYDGSVSYPTPPLHHSQWVDPHAMSYQ
ncbi:hypothetical protein HanIR_Chr07g0332271 [Helianthus annuus]|nr:hypothetical protein HanIR_Chr07g0332271 [Helianthus annuus]